MERDEAIRYIEMLYPPDSECIKTSEKGRELLEQAKHDGWRTESTEVLIRFAQLCIEEDALRNRHESPGWGVARRVQ